MDSTAKSIAAIFSFQVLLIAQPSTGLQCHKCSYFHADSDSNILSFFLSQVKRASDTHCKLDTREDWDKALLRTCPPPDNSGEEMKCVTLEGKTTTTILTLEVSVETVTRDCVSVPKNDWEFANGCHDRLPQNRHVRGVLDTAFKGLNKLSSLSSGNDLGSTNWHGTTCYGWSNSASGVHAGFLFIMLVSVMLSLVLKA